MSKRQIVRSNSDTRFFNNKEVYETSNYNLNLLKKQIEFDFKLDCPTQSNKESVYKDKRKISLKEFLQVNEPLNLQNDAQESIISY